jgi:hypothetical protein
MSICIEGLFGSMALEEKIAQMLCVLNDKNKTLLDDKGIYYISYNA